MHKIKLKNSDNMDVAREYPDYRFHITDSIIFTSDRKMLASLVVAGIPFETENDNVLTNLFNSVKNFLIGLGKEGDLYLWTHLIKKRITIDGEWNFDNDFLSRFSKKYLALFTSSAFYKSTWYLTFGIPYDDVDTGIERMNEMTQQAQKALQPFNASVLSVHNTYISEVADYLSLLLNTEHNMIPLSSTPLSSSICDSEWYFGADVLELRNNESDSKKFATNYILKDFPIETTPGQWDFLLKQPYEFILTQSFIFESPTKTLKNIDSQLNKLQSANDAAKTQQEELEAGKEAVAAGITLFGSLHCALTVFGDTPDQARSNGIKLSAEFITSGKGFRFSRASLASPFVFFSHMPLNKRRPLDTRRTITNLACLMSFHNYSSGKKSGNPIGDGSAIMPLKTVSDSIYWFNTHYSPPEKNVTGQKIAGHGMILGATGTGKTTFEAAASGFLQRFDPLMFVVDFNRSTELFVRAYGGSYFTLQEGIYTGCNPWQLAEGPESPVWHRLLAFLKRWTQVLARDNQGNPCSDEHGIELNAAVESIMRMPVEERRTALLLDIVSPELQTRLAKWCDNGEYAWAVDSPRNTFNPLHHKKVAFDTTVVLDTKNGIHPACEPLLAVLFFYKEIMQRGGNLMLSIIEEFWMPANFPMTQSMIKSALKAGRMKGEMMWLTSQSPEDAINCAIFAALVQQTATKILLPNPDAKWEGYKEIGLTEKEFEKLKELTKESRTMLIKQSGSSVFAKMDLFGFDEFIPVLSGSETGLSIFDEIIAEKGDVAPDIWIPELLKRLNG
ncbi:TPA: conjugal transfer protein [Escherichia coli]